MHVQPLCALQQLPAIGLADTAAFTSKVDANCGDVLGDKFLLAVALDQARLASARLPHADNLPTTQCTPHQDLAGRISQVRLRVAGTRGFACPPGTRDAFRSCAPERVACAWRRQQGTQDPRGTAGGRPTLMRMT